MITVSEDKKVAEFHEALARAFAAVTPSEASGRDGNKKKAGKDRPYSTLADVDRACRGALTSEGFSYPQHPTTRWTEDGRMFVTVKTTLMRDGVDMTEPDPFELPVLGQRLSNSTGGGYGPPDAQSVGSGITYLRRYSLTALMGICPEDDDGHAASTQSESKPDPRWDAFQTAVRRLAAMRKVEHDAAYAMVRVEAKIQPGKDGPTDPQLVVLTEVAESMAKPQPSPMDRLNDTARKLSARRNIHLEAAFSEIELEAGINPDGKPTAAQVVTLLGAAERLLAAPTERPSIERGTWLGAAKTHRTWRVEDFTAADGGKPSEELMAAFLSDIQDISAKAARLGPDKAFNSMAATPKQLLAAAGALEKDLAKRMQIAKDGGS